MKGRGRPPDVCLRRHWHILYTFGSRLEEVGEVGDSERVAIGGVGVDRASARRGEVARMPGVILKTVNPSVDATGLCR